MEFLAQSTVAFKFVLAALHRIPVTHIIHIVGNLANPICETVIIPTKHSAAYLRLVSAVHIHAFLVRKFLVGSRSGIDEFS